MKSRIEAIGDLIDTHSGAFFIFSNGLTAREAAHFYRRSQCFYMLHAMGESLAVGVGLAQVRPELEVVVIEGDGNAFMGLSAWSLMPLPNVHYYVLDNRCYETTGGQELPALPFIPTWCNVIPIKRGKANTPNPPAPGEIWANCKHWLGEELGQGEPSQ